MRRISHDLQGFAVLAVAVAVGAFILLRNVQPGASYTVLSGTGSPSPSAAGQDPIRETLAGTVTPLPTPVIPISVFQVPTNAPSSTPTQIPVTNVFLSGTPTPTRFALSGPTQSGPTPAASPAGLDVGHNSDPRRGEFSPPPEIAPLSLDPRDHYWFQRPVDSSANATALFTYPYGSDGLNNLWRVHHGIDLPNPIGKSVRAAAPGRVVWAADDYVWKEGGKVERAYPYGNVIIIEHDFGYQGKRLFTLYAHLQAFLVKVNDRVSTGQIIGLSGNTGVVSGPHVHFEVRVGTNSYWETRNPVLWMVPFLNHGVIAGRVLWPNGSPVEDAEVQLRQGRRIIDTTTTYVNPRRPNMSSQWNVNSDEVWNEDFVFGDVPVGDYQVAVSVNGIRYFQDVTVRPATTTMVDFGTVGSKN